MLIIDARKDNHKDFEDGTTRGAIAKYALELGLNDGLAIERIYDKEGREVGVHDVRNQLTSLCQIYGCKFRVVSFNNFIVVSMKSIITKTNPRQVWVPSKVIAIDTESDHYKDYRKGTVRGAIAKYVLAMDVGDIIAISRVTHNGVEQTSGQIRSQLQQICRSFGYIFTVHKKRKEGQTYVKLLQKRSKIQKQKHVNNPPVGRMRVTEEKELLHIDHDLANSFLTRRMTA